MQPDSPTDITDLRAVLDCLYLKFSERDGGPYAVHRPLPLNQVET